jgi:hypothetical protein
LDRGFSLRPDLEVPAMDDREGAFDHFGGAWRSLDPPAPDDGPEPRDPVTRRAVSWLAAAWHMVPVPAVPAVPAVGTARPVRHHVRRAAAAAILISASALAWNEWHRREALAPPPASPATGPPPASVVLAGPDRIEVRSGDVRLILLTSTEDSLPVSVPDLDGEVR